MNNDDQLHALERLAKLRDTGALSEEEFTAKKTAILNSPVDVRAPFYRRLWLVVLLTCLILTFPVALIILLTGNVYKKADGIHVPIGNKARYIYASVLGLWLAAAIVKAILDPSELNMESKKAPTPPSSQSTNSAGSTAPASAPAPNDNSAPPPGSQSADDSNQPEQATNGPNMKVEVPLIGDRPEMTVTGDDDQPFTITRIIFNGRASEVGCDYPDYSPPNTPAKKLSSDPLTAIQQMQLPFASTFKRGEQQTYLPRCGKILSAEIQTDRGTVTYKFDN